MIASITSPHCQALDVQILLVHTFSSSCTLPPSPLSLRNSWTCVTCFRNLRGGILSSNISSISAGVRRVSSGNTKYPITQEIIPVAPKLGRGQQKQRAGEARPVHAQISGSDAPHLEHERNSVVEDDAQDERAHQCDGGRPSAEPLVRNLGHVRIRDRGTSDDSKVGNARPEYLHTNFVGFDALLGTFLMSIPKRFQAVRCGS